MWPFKSQEQRASAADKARLIGHEVRISDLELDLSLLLKRLQKLEGTTYGRRSAQLAQDQEDDSKLTKSQLRAKLGIIPGRPVNIR